MTNNNQRLKYLNVWLKTVKLDSVASARESNVFFPHCGQEKKKDSFVLDFPWSDLDCVVRKGELHVKVWVWNSRLEIRFFSWMAEKPFLAL